MKRIVFLDRDGVINRDHADYTYTLERFVVLPGVPEQIARLKEAGWLVAVITNQSGIAKRLYGHTDVALVHAHLEQVLAQSGTAVDGIWYCPHHPDYSACLCRKPGSLLVEKALALLGADPAQSWFIGDRPRDIEAAQRAGVRGILVDTDAPLQPVVDRILLDALV
jgi:D-glycero-D-manno-heptose 1,7-bisphosphate phosphatase